MRALTRGVLLLLGTLLALTPPAHAYVDPGLTGAVYQIGYLLVYGFMAMLAFFFRPIKAFWNNMLRKLGLKKAPLAAPRTDSTAESGAEPGVPAASSPEGAATPSQPEPQDASPAAETSDTP